MKCLLRRMLDETEFLSDHGLGALLRLQLHAYAACSDPVIRDFVRAEFAALVAAVADLSGEPAANLGEFFAQGMLMNVAAAMDLSEAQLAWQRMCEGGPSIL